MNKQAFTLVELIVVITILAILGTIGFISLQGYTRDARDSVRLSDMKNIIKGLEVAITTKGKLPIPEDKIDITASGIVISYQGYAGKKILNQLGISGGTDPLDKTYYTYVSNSKLTKYQLMGFLEGNIIGFNNNIIKTANALELEERIPYTSGSELGILLSTGTLNPVQLSSENIDIINTNNEYISYLNNISDGKRQGTGSTLEVSMYHLINPEGSCNTILKNGKSNGDGMYNIDPEKDGIGFSVYCDMTTDGGGWTMLTNAKEEGAAVFTYNDILSWIPKSSNDCSLDTECLSNSGVKLKNWDSLMVYTRGYKVKGTECNDKKLTIKGYTGLPLLNKVNISNWSSLTNGAHGKCNSLSEVSKGLKVSTLSSHTDPWPIHMGVRFTSNDNINEHSLLFFGPIFIPQGFGNTRNFNYKKLNNHYGEDTKYQTNPWDGASTARQTWFIR